jgi:hypothetical protein
MILQSAIVTETLIPHRDPNYHGLDFFSLQSSFVLPRILIVATAFPLPSRSHDGKRALDHFFPAMIRPAPTTTNTTPAPTGNFSSCSVVTPI